MAEDLGLPMDEQLEAQMDHGKEEQWDGQLVISMGKSSGKMKV
jgi:hypothetical protein